MDKRVWLKQQQRHVKLAYNKLQAARDAYKGRQAATSLADALITMQCVVCRSNPQTAATSSPHRALPSMPLGDVHDLPGLHPAAHDALLNRQERALAALRQAVTGLHDALGTLQDAAASLEDDSNDAALWSTQPVFVSYTMQQLAGFVEAVASDYRRDVDVKQRVCDAMQRMVAGQCGVLSDPVLESTLQVWLATWMLSPAVDDDACESKLQLIKAEMNGY